MAQQFVSPGVETNEIDLSFLEAGVTSIGSLIVGSSNEGIAFYPVSSPNFDQWRARFGDLAPKHQSSYAAKNTLKNSSNLTFMRVLGHKDGTGVSNGYTLGGITAISDASGTLSATGSILAVIHHSGTYNVVTVAGVSGDANNFVISVGAVFATTASFVTSSANYIGKVMNTDPTKYDTYGHYLAEVYKYKKQAASASWWAVATTSASWKSFDRDYEYGETTWIKSQLLGGNEFDLFRFFTRADGRATNDKLKVQITNVKPATAPTVYPFGTFDVVVRKFDDTDLRPVILESFANLTLDSASPNYIARKIGDTYETFDTTQRKFIVQEGMFPNKSKYVRVQMNTTQDAPSEAVPWGFRGYPKVTFSGSAVIGANNVPELPYTPNMKDANSSFNTNISWGVLFVSGGIVDRMRALPDISAGDAWMTGSDTDFSLKFLSGTYETGQLRYNYNTAVASNYQPIMASASLQKFTMPFRGGFDGFDLRVTNPLYLTNTADDSNHSVISLKRALDAIKNPDVVNYNVLAIPAVHNLRVTDYARNLVNERKDVFYVMDVTGSSVQEVVSQLQSREIDDNYTACYYPDLKVDDKINNTIVRVAPSVAVLGALAFSDRVKAVFFAPAGLERGGLKQFDVIDTVDRLDHNDRNSLYENRINPIATFPDEGIVIFGQKTLQLRASSLDRVNVRRLLIFAKKTVAAAARHLVFEPNDPTEWQKFVNKVNPILEGIRRDRGINRFKVVMDSSTNTQDVIDRNGMYGKIFLEPLKAGEFISIDFIITNAGVQFTS